MFRLNYTSVPEKEYRSVDIFCYDVDLMITPWFRHKYKYEI